MATEREITDALAERMEVSISQDGSREISLEGELVGRLTSPQAGVWECQWMSKSGLQKAPGKHVAKDYERAELWAVREVAAQLAKELLAQMREGEEEP